MLKPPRLFSDLYRYVPGGGESQGLNRIVRFIGVAVLSSNWHACLVLRISQWCWVLYLWPFAILFQKILLHWYGIDIPPSVPIGRGLWMPHARNIVVHRQSSVGSGVTLFHNVTIGGRDYSGYPAVGNQVLLGVGCSVLGSIDVGDGARIGAHALVTKNVPPNAVMVGVPAHPVRSSDEGDQLHTEKQ
jgi:serine O-acetyltransferase